MIHARSISEDAELEVKINQARRNVRRKVVDGFLVNDLHRGIGRDVLHTLAEKLGVHRFDEDTAHSHTRVFKAELKVGGFVDNGLFIWGHEC